jgi:HEAT repeat protein
MAKLLEQVRTRLSSANVDEQVEAAHQLAERREWDALPDLLRLLRHDECGYSVAQALRAFGPEVCDQVGLLLLDEQKAVQYRAAWTLAAFGDKRAVKPMLAALSEPYFHEPFLPVLSRMGVPDFDSILVKELARHHEDTSYPSARFRASAFLWAMTQMRAPTALHLAPHFTQDHHDKLVRQRAQRYLEAVDPNRHEQAG